MQEPSASNVAANVTEIDVPELSAPTSIDKCPGEHEATEQEPAAGATSGESPVETEGDAGESHQYDNAKTEHVLIEVPDEAAKLLVESEARYTFQGLETESPVLIVGDVRLRGRYKEVVGTDMIFDPAKREAAGFVAGATRRLVFEEEVDMG